MSEVFNLISTHISFLLIAWFIFSVLIMYYLRNTYYSLFDPIIIMIVLIIAPGFSGILMIVKFYGQYSGFEYKSILLILSIASFFYFFRFPFRNKPVLSHETIIFNNFSWQLIVLLFSTFFIILNLLINGNFDSKDPSLRFNSVSIPILNYLSIALFIYPALFFAFTRISKVRIISALLIILITLVQLNVGVGKSFFISFLFIYFYWIFSRNQLQIGEIIYSLRRYLVSIHTVKVLGIAFILGMIGIISLVLGDFVNAAKIMIRFVLSFDSPIVFITSPNVHTDVMSDITGYSSFAEVWFKPFLKNIFGFTYSYENISQYIAYEMTGYRANSYVETSWQPNNNLVIDFLVIHGWIGVFLSGLAGYILGKIYLFLKIKNIISIWLFPIFAVIIIKPFYFFIDAQSFFTSLILSVIFIYSINIIFLILTRGVKNHFTEK